MKTMSFQTQYTSIIITYFVTKCKHFFFLDFFLFLIIFLCLFFSKVFFWIFYFFSFWISFFLFFSKLFSSIIYHNYFISSNFNFLLSSFFFIEHAHFMPNILVLHKPSKKPANILCFKCEYCKIILTKLMFNLWPLCKYFTLNFIFLKFI